MIQTEEMKERVQIHIGKRVVVYIAGPMAGLINKNRDNFDEAEAELKHLGYVVLNPAVLPDGMDYSRYMPICLSMVEQADAVLMLPGWEKSKGASLEHQYAQYQSKLICTSVNELDSICSFGKLDV